MPSVENGCYLVVSISITYLMWRLFSCAITEFNKRRHSGVCIFQSEMSKEFPNSKGEVGSRLRTTSMADSSGSRAGPDPMGMKRFTSKWL